MEYPETSKAAQVTLRGSLDGGQEGTTQSVVCILALMVSQNVFKRSVKIDLLFSDHGLYFPGCCDRVDHDFCFGNLSRVPA